MSRRTSKRKSESCAGTKDTKTVQPSNKPDTHPPEILHHEDQRKTVRRSSRLSLGSCEMGEVSCEASHTDTDAPSSSTLSIPELHESNSGNDMQEATQGNTAEDKLKTSALDENEMNNRPQKEVNVEEEIQATDSRVATVGDLEAHQIDDMAMDAKADHLTETQSSPPFSIKHPDPPQKRANKRVANKRKLEPCEGQKDSNIAEDITTKLHSTSSEPLHHEDTRKSRRSKSSRLNPGPSKGSLEPAQEDIVAPLPPSSSKVFIEQTEAEKQNARCSLTEPSEEQEAGKRSSVEVTGRRSSMRGAAKAVSYKEIPLNVKMRRP
uniref:Uncharacterized protein n=1 Tax=Avena sativa TaxID=4498 RepID=A0ACD5YVP2_AVESA